MVRGRVRVRARARARVRVLGPVQVVAAQPGWMEGSFCLTD